MQAAKGTRNLLGEDVRMFREVTQRLIQSVEKKGYEEFIPSALTLQALWTEKSGPEIANQMWTFPGKGEKPEQYALIPEVTGVVQELYRENWSKSRAKPVRLYYLTRCYRYEKPQAGRYREFWQFGIECLGGDSERALQETYTLLELALQESGLDSKNFEMSMGMPRGLAYYTKQENNFEAVAPSLGAQKQIAGGGVYEEGVGWAIGVERLILALEKQKSNA